nr:hypothetical protein P5627_08105 [Bacillus safensis]
MKRKIVISLSLFCTILGGAFLIDRNDQKRWQIPGVNGTAVF